MVSEEQTRPAVRSFAFGPFVLVPERQLLLERDILVQIGSRARDILTALVERPGEVVTKRELFARAWPNTTVEEGNLKVHMVALRRILGQDADTQYIATVIGRGYRFVVPVRTSDWADTPMERLPLAQRQHNLPAGLTRLIGRADTIETIGRELTQSRLVSIIGAGGAGKSTVALAIAARQVGSTRDGVWHVDFAPLKDPALVPGAIAAAIGMTAHSANMLAALCEYLRDSEMLLVLDSCECEHIINAVASCAERILANAPGVKILATSREPLKVKGERIRRLTGLALPPQASELTAREALGFAAVQLFVDRATDRMENFAFADADAPIVAEICQRIDGLPLAIELAATRVDLFGVAGLIEQIRQRIHLQIEQRAGPERHRTLIAAIDWSHDLLSPREQTVLRRLSVLASSFSLAAACAVVEDKEIESAAVIEDLASLVEKSLLAAEMGEVEVKYRLLDTTRAYALEKLATSRELSATRLRHAQYFLALARAATGDAASLGRQAWLDRYGMRIDDLRDALKWTFGSADRADLGIQLTVAMIAFWNQQSLLEECRAAVERALDPRFAEVRDSQDEFALSLAFGATLLHTQGPLLQVKEVLTRALAIAEDIGEVARQRECLRGLSEYELWTGDSHAALAVAEKIRVLEGSDGGPASSDAEAPAGSALSWLGALAASQRRLEIIVHRPMLTPRTDGARFAFDQRLTARGALATVLWLQGFPDQAVEMARLQLAEAEDANFAVSLCYALVHGSLVVSLYVRDYSTASGYLRRGETHAARHRLTIWQAMARCVRTRLELYLGQRVDLAANREALAEVRETGFRMRYPNYLTNYGEALARQEDFRGGLAIIDEAIALSQASGQVVGIPEMLRIKGNVLRLGDHAFAEQAREYYEQSIALARRDGALSWELRSVTGLVEYWRERGGNAEAEEMLVAAYNRFHEGFWTGDLKRARALIDSR